MRKLRVLATLLMIAALLLGCTMMVDPNFQPPSSQNSSQGMGQGIEPDAAHWGTWLLPSADALRPAAPPDSDATQAEIAEIHAMLDAQDAAAQESVSYWDAGAPPYRWHQIAFVPLRTGPPGASVSRALALLNVAIYDTTVATWDAKYTYNRPHPSELDSSITPLVDSINSPSYPSEHAAVAGAASTVLSYLFPDQADYFAAQAEEAAQSRVLAGANYPSDVEAGLALGRAVGERVVEWAKADGYSVPWEGEVPTGPGLWVGKNPGSVTAGTWGTWVLTSGDQMRPAPPPAFDSEEIQAQIAEIKSITHTVPIVQKTTFWGGFEGGYTYWYDKVATYLFERGLDRNPPYAALVYVTTAVANHDAAVACHEAKFVYWFIRPPQLDPTITTIVPVPNHPSYPAGAACAFGGLSTAIGNFFPTEKAALDAAADEGAESRVWAGIHYRSDIEAGLKLGRDVGKLVNERVAEMTQP